MAHSGRGKPGSANRFPNGITDAAETTIKAVLIRVRFNGFQVLTRATVIRQKFVFFKYKLVVYIL